MTNHKLAVIILNYNGWKDTIDCLLSLNKSLYKSFSVILIDNRSQNDSVPNIKDFLSKTSLEYPCRFIENSENLGFAAGNNVGIKLADEANAEYVMLLNNDTVVEADALGMLVESMDSHPDIWAITPQIRYYDDKNLIWNCGGKFYRIGLRKYFYCGQKVSEVPVNKMLVLTYITGCALLYRYKKAGMLTERFFFGEEDVDISLRIRKMKGKIACLTSAVIYHKVGRSFAAGSGKKPLGSVYIYYLNRFIHMRIYMKNRLLWFFWASVMLLYMSYLLVVRLGYSTAEVLKMFRQLINDSTHNDGVSKELFLKSLNRKF